MWTGLAKVIVLRGKLRLVAHWAGVVVAAGKPVQAVVGEQEDGIADRRPLEPARSVLHSRHSRSSAMVEALSVRVEALSARCLVAAAAAAGWQPAKARVTAAMT